MINLLYQNESIVVDGMVAVFTVDVTVMDEKVQVTRVITKESVIGKPRRRKEQVLEL